MSLKKELEEKLHASVRLAMGKPGALDVYADGKKIFSKHEAGHPPTFEELAALLPKA